MISIPKCSVGRMTIPHMPRYSDYTWQRLPVRTSAMSLGSALLCLCISNVSARPTSHHDPLSDHSFLWFLAAGLFPFRSISILIRNITWRIGSINKPSYRDSILRTCSRKEQNTKGFDFDESARALDTPATTGRYIFLDNAMPTVWRTSIRL